MAGQFDVEDLGWGLARPFSILEGGEVVPDGDEIGKIAAEAPLAVAIEADSTIDAFDTAGSAMKLFEDLEEMALNIWKIGATRLKLLLDSLGDQDRFCAITSLRLVFPESSEGCENVVPVLGGRSVDAEGRQSGVEFRQEGQKGMIVQGVFHLGPAGG